MAPMRRLRFLVVLSIRKFAADNGGLMAAAIAYWAIVSVLPVILLLLGLFGIALQGSDLRDRVIDEVLQILPFSEEQGRKEVTETVEAISSARGGVLGIVGLIVAAWSGSNMFGAIRQSLSLVFHEASRRPPVQEKLLDLGMVVGLAPFFLASLSATAILRIARRTSEGLPIIDVTAKEWGLGWDVLSLLAPLTISFTAFAVLYSFAPAKRLRLAVVWPGALVAGSMFELSKLGFSVYLERFATHEVVYGSLGVIVAFFVWTYISATILLFGAEVVSEYPKVSAWQYESGGTTNVPPHSLKNKFTRFIHSLVFRD